MKLQLLGSMPCSRVDYVPLCRDGRGGWVYSQVGADRYVAGGENFGVLLGFNMLASPSLEDDHIEASRLVAQMSGVAVGDSTLQWAMPNRGGAFHAGVKIYEWIQAVNLFPPGDGLVTVAISVKLHSHDGFLPVHGRAYCHLTEEATERKRLSPLRYCLKKLAAKNWAVGGDLDLQRSLYGTGIPPRNDDEEILARYERAAEMGLPHAQGWCGEVYAMGINRARDIERGARWLKAAVEAGVTRAKYVLAVLMVTGQGVPKNVSEGLPLCSEAAAEGELDAEYMIGRMYERGVGLERSVEKAIESYEKAARRGHASAQERLKHLRR